MKIEKTVIEELVRSADRPPAPPWAHQPASVSLLLFERETTHFLAVLKADRQAAHDPRAVDPKILDDFKKGE